MKKLLVIVLCFVMVISLAACSEDTGNTAENTKNVIENAAENVKKDVTDTLGNADETAKNVIDTAENKVVTVAADVTGNIAGIANPVVAVESLEALNEKLGYHMVKPGVMGVTDESFAIIGESLGEYRFTVGGYNYSLRCQGTMEDICGIYGDNGTLFEGKDAEETYAEGAGYKAVRWFTTDGQYVLSVNDNGEMGRETFEGIADEIAAGVRSGFESNSDIFEELNGSYEDTNSQRATALAEAADDSAKITVSWSNSAFETSVWTMNVSFEDGKLVYTDCTKTVEPAPEDGNAVISENGKGYFTYSDGKLLWDGAAEESCRGCVFEKMEGFVGIANPVVAVESLEALNEKLGYHMVKPGVMGVTDESFVIINNDLGEYSFTVGGYSYSLRCRGTMEDICGIYGDNGTLFEGKAAEETYAEGSGYKTIRWFTTDGQYVLSVNDNGEMGRETFEGIAEEIQAGIAQSFE